MFFKKLFCILKPLKTKTIYFFLVSLGFLVFFENMVFDFRIDEITKELNKAYIEKADVVFEYNDLKREEALKQARLYSHKITEGLLQAFNGDKDAIINDLQGIVDRKYVACLSTVVINNIIRNVTLNKVPYNDRNSNDLIVLLANLIINDLSDDCATDKPIRTIVEEANQQFAPKLAYKALLDITKYNKESTFWHYSPLLENSPYFNFIKSMESTDINDLKKSFIKHNSDLEFLKHFEFLAISRIQDGEDIAGRPTLQPNGTRNKQSLQLHVIQGYNLITQINIDPIFKLKLVPLDYSIDNIKNQIAREKFIKDITFLILAVVFFSLYSVLSEKEE